MSNKELDSFIKENIKNIPQPPHDHEESMMQRFADDFNQHSSFGFSWKGFTYPAFAIAAIALTFLWFNNPNKEVEGELTAYEILAEVSVDYGQNGDDSESFYGGWDFMLGE